jgi:hypothetical protein
VEIVAKSGEASTPNATAAAARRVRAAARTSRTIPERWDGIPVARRVAASQRGFQG